MTKLTALIFDVDGTLADTEEIHRLAFNAAFADFNLDWNWSRQLYMELLSISGGSERMRHYTESLGTAFKRPPDLDEYIARLHRLKTEHYGRMLVEGHVKLRPGVERLLDEAREQGIRLAIATSTALSNVKTLLDNNLPESWGSWFEVIASCDIIESKKPSPAVYQFVLAEMNVLPETCMAIEDTQNGNLAALAAGIKTIITTHYFTRQHEFPGACLVIDTLGEPDQPFKVCSGDSMGARCVTIDLMRRLLGLTETRRGRSSRTAASLLDQTCA